MSIMSNIVPYLISNHPKLRCAFDFANTNPETLSVVSSEGTVPASVTFTGIESVDQGGVTLTGSQAGNLTANFGTESVTLVFVLTPAVQVNFTFYQKDVSDSGVYLTSEALFPRTRWRSRYWGSYQVVDSLTAIEPNKPNLVSFGFHTDTDSQIYDITHGVAGVTPANRHEEQVGRSNGVALSGGELFSGFDGNVAGFFVIGGMLTQTEVDNLILAANIYGSITLTTNLDASRFQGGVAIKSDKAVDSTFSVPVDQTGITIYSLAPLGSLLSFYAFDSDEAGTILAVKDFNPDLDSDLVFAPLIGGAPGGQSQASKVSGIVQIDGTPAQRTVRAFGYNPTTHDLNATTVNLSKSLGHATSDPDTGEYTIDLLAGYGKEIFVVAFDDYGADFTADMAVAVGDRVHPATPNGHVFECTGAGNLPATEPTWVVDTATGQLYGTASMIARPFYRPMVHGPVVPEVTELVGGVPPAAKWRLMIYEGNGDPRLSIAEWELFDLDGIKVAIGAATASSEYSASYAADLAKDSDPVSVWLTISNTNEWIEFSVSGGAPAEIGSMTIQAGAGSNGAELAPFKFSLEYEDPNTGNWIEYSQWLETNWQISEVRTFNL